ncbi:hypothetical protein GTO27_11015 [Candidatus Bathyarchaeota archaeon]|nr:hypothetical protein [Candidatus Bathyarchaeota archaeon]
MVKKLVEKGKILYACERCGLKYGERDWAEKCERFCTDHNACSLEITKYAVEKP